MMHMDCETGSYQGKPRPAVTAALVPVAALLTGCSGGRDPSGEFYTHWDLAGGCTSGIVGDDWVDAGGHLVNVCNSVNLAGSVWVSYAAAWCAASRDQAAEVRHFSNNARVRDDTRKSRAETAPQVPAQSPA